MQGQNEYWLPWYDNMVDVPLTKFFYYLTHPGKALIAFLKGLSPYLYWIAVILSSIFLIYYAATKSPKCLRIIGYIIITYILLKGIGAVL